MFSWPLGYAGGIPLWMNPEYILEGNGPSQPGNDLISDLDAETCDNTHNTSTNKASDKYIVLATALSIFFTGKEADVTATDSEREAS